MHYKRECMHKHCHVDLIRVSSTDGSQSGNVGQMQKSVSMFFFKADELTDKSN